MIQYHFPGKVVLVTGSSRGIGAAILEGFARGGATCVLHFWDDPDGGNKRDAQALAEKLKPTGAPTHVFAADVRDATQVEALMKQVKDQLGGLALTIDGLQWRDRFVFDTARTKGVPVAVVLAGGYAINVKDTVTIHANTVVAARQIYGASTN